MKPSSAPLLPCILRILTLVALGNAAAWSTALLLFGGHGVLIATAILAFTLGLRHGVDADHIAAIDNATRKLVGDGRQPVTAGLFFSLGHAAVVALLCLALALAASGMRARYAGLAALAPFGTILSACLLFALAAINAAGLVPLWRAARRGEVTPAPQGWIGRLAPRLLSWVSKSWQLFPLGFLFGLGFDTASEVGLLALSAAEAGRGLSLWAVMIFPALFAAGMALVDTLDAVLMLGLYRWSFQRPGRRLAYNLTVTLLSIFAALGIGLLELMGLRAPSSGSRFWHLVAAANQGSAWIGTAMIVLFAASWIAAFFWSRRRLEPATR